MTSILSVSLVLLAFTACVSGTAPSDLRITVTDGKYSWELLGPGDTSLVKSEAFPDREACVRSAVALLANGANTRHCKAVVVGSSMRTDGTLAMSTVTANGQTLERMAWSTTLASDEGDVDLHDDKVNLKTVAQQTVNCQAVESALESLARDYMVRHKRQPGKPWFERKKAGVFSGDYFELHGSDGKSVMTSKGHFFSGNKGLHADMLSTLLNGGVKSSYHLFEKRGVYGFRIKSMDKGGRAVSVVGKYKDQSEAEAARRAVERTVREALRVIVEDRLPREATTATTTTATTATAATTAEVKPQEKHRSGRAEQQRGGATVQTADQRDATTAPSQSPAQQPQQPSSSSPSSPVRGRPQAQRDAEEQEESTADEESSDEAEESADDE